ncbi:DUF4349 domain-containing protein [Streptosporangium sp. NPDC000239]|uniref:DUF4349 domain-containing protein n=1 Tax=Streptosporangium sp. NPDC000239 TaxID=3154248 RepID=UPI003318FB81
MRKLAYGVCVTAIALSLSSCAGQSMRSIPDSGGSAENQAAPAMAESSPRPGKEAAPKRDEQVKLVAQDRAIIYTAELTVRAKDVVAAADTARRIVTTAGGYLSTEKSDTGYGDRASTSLTFKVPPSAYPGVLQRLGGELGRRESLQQNTEDVTEQVADVESRLRSSQAALDSLRSLMKKAKTIGEVLDVEREVSAREADLESLQARQKTLASQTSMATLTLNLIGPEVTVEEPEEESPGFLGGLRSGWRSLVSAVGIGLVVLGALLPWLAVLGLVGLAVVLLRRLFRGGSAPAAPDREPVEPAETARVSGPAETEET